MGTLESVIQEPVSRRTRPNGFYVAMDKLLTAVDKFSECVPVHSQERIVFLSGECKEIFDFMERQSQRLKELQTEIGGLETGLAYERQRADCHEAQLVEIAEHLGEDARNAGSIANVVKSRLSSALT